jgi:hypothetical protein
MPDDNVNLSRRKRGRRQTNVINQRTSVEPMQNFCQIRAHSRAESGGENQYVERFLFAGKIIHKKNFAAENTEEITE